MIAGTDIWQGSSSLGEMIVPTASRSSRSTSPSQIGATIRSCCSGAPQLLLVDCQGCLDHLGPVEPGHRQLAAGAAHGGDQLRVVQQLGHRGGEALGVVERADEPGAPLDHGVAAARSVGGDDRCARRVYERRPRPPRGIVGDHQ